MLNKLQHKTLKLTPQTPYGNCWLITT